MSQHSDENSNLNSLNSSNHIKSQTSISSFQSSDDYSLHMESKKPKPLQLKPKRLNLRQLINKLTKEDIPEYLKYIKNQKIQEIFNKNQDFQGRQKNTISDLKSDLKVKKYYNILLFLTAKISKRDFLKVNFYNQVFEIDENSQIDIVNEILSNSEFLEKLIISIFETQEDLVYDLLIKNIPKLELLINANIITSYLNYQKTNELKYILSQFKNQPDLKTENSTLVEQNLGQVAQIFIQNQKTNLLLQLFQVLSITIHQVFQQLVIFSKDSILIEFYKKFPISLQNDDYDLLQLHRRYLFILKLPKLFILEFLEKKKRNQQMLHDFERIIHIDIILFILFRIKNRISNVAFVNQFFKKCEDIVEKEYTKSPLFFSKNPLKFAFLIYLLLKTFNKRLKLQNEDFNRLAELYQTLCFHIIDFLPQNVLQEYIFHQDLNQKIFLDYLFKINALQVVQTRFIRKSIQSFWKKKIHFNQKMIYYQNSRKAPTTYIYFIESSKVPNFSNIIQLNKRFLSLTQLKYSIFKDSLKFRLFIQIINSLLFAIMELIFIFTLDNMEVSEKSIFQFLFENKKNNIFYSQCSKDSNTLKFN